MAVVITHTASFEYTAVDTDHDEAGVAIGSAAADRLVFVLTSGITSTSTDDINSLSVGGVAATRVRRQLVTYDSAAAGAFQSLEIWWAAVPTGTTATVSFTHDADVSAIKLSLYSVTGANTDTPVTDDDSATRTDALTNALSVAVDVPSGGAIGIAAGAIYDISVTVAWTYLTENLDNDQTVFGFFAGFSTASAVAAVATPAQTITATMTGTSAALSDVRGLVVVAIQEFVEPGTVVASAAGTAAGTAVASVVANVVANAAGTGGATASSRSVASAAASSSGVATVEAEGDFSSDSAVGSAAGTATATAATAVIASVAGLAEGSATATAALPEVPAATYPPVGGGGGIAPPYYSEQQRFRIRKEKSKPRVYVIKTGNWPTEEELARAEREEQREFSRFVNGIQPNRAAPVESDDEEELSLILSMLA